MIIDCISDLHGHYPTLEGGDLLIVAGDLTERDLPHERLVFLQWLAGLDYKRKIFIGGNHDNSLIGMGFQKTREDGVDYLCDSGTEFEWQETEDTKWGPKHLPGCRSLKLKIWGSPWTKTFPGMNPRCKAFTVDTEEELAEKWALIPDDVDILVTHSPPYGILDKTIDGLNIGSVYLRGHLNRVRPLLHICGHIHEAYGRDIYQYEVFCGERSIDIVNASHVNECYEPMNKPVRMIL